MQAARSELKRIGLRPEECSVDDAWAVLNDVLLADPDAMCSIWLRDWSGIGTQERLFRKEWERWQREYRSRLMISSPW